MHWIPTNSLFFQVSSGSFVSLPFSRDAVSKGSHDCCPCLPWGRGLRRVASTWASDNLYSRSVRSYVPIGECRNETVLAMRRDIAESARGRRIVWLFMVTSLRNYHGDVRNSRRACLGHGHGALLFPSRMTLRRLTDVARLAYNESASFNQTVSIGRTRRL